LISRITKEGHLEVAPLVLEKVVQGPDGTVGMPQMRDLLPGKVFDVKSSRSSTEEEIADLLWLENLELNRYAGGKAMTETMWRCDQVRAGQLYNRMMFDTREEAVRFARKMQQMEPDQTFSIEAIEAKQVWN